MAKTTPPEQVDSLLAEVERLKKALIEKDEALEKVRVEAATSQGLAMLQQREIHEIPTGKMVKVLRCTKYKTAGYRDDGRPIRQPEFEEVEVPSYFYRIDLPASGGTGLKLNGEEFTHGLTYELDIDLLRTVKDMVHRSWAHEAQIKGSNENFYRRPKNVMLGKGGVIRAGAR